MHLKSEDAAAAKTQLKQKIRQVSDAFYNMGNLLGGAGEEENKDPEKKISMSSTALDEHDKMKEMWAFNMPCMLLVNGGR